MIVALLMMVATLAPGGGSAAGAAAAAAHDLHVTYGAAAVENDVVIVRVRFFLDDLTNALRRHAGRADLALEDDPVTDAAFLAYFGTHFGLTVHGTSLVGRIVASGRDELDREPVWWYAVQFDAPAKVTALRVRNTLLLELFDDQRNIVKFVHFPDQTQKTYSFGRGEEAFDVVF
jgi:hypothetical protein